MLTRLTPPWSQRFDDFASGSIAHITSSWAYESCKRFKFEVFGDFSRSVHNLALEVAMCFEVHASPGHPRSIAACYRSSPLLVLSSRRTP